MLLLPVVMSGIDGLGVPLALLSPVFPAAVICICWLSGSIGGGMCSFGSCTSR